MKIGIMGLDLLLLILGSIFLLGISIVYEMKLVKDVLVLTILWNAIDQWMCMEWNMRNILIGWVR